MIKKTTTFSVAYRSQILSKAVGCFPLPVIFLRDGHTRLVRIARFTTLPISELCLICKTVGTCNRKHLQNCFRAIDFPRWRGRKTVVKMFYLRVYHFLSSTRDQHAKTFAKMFWKCFATFLQMFYAKTFAKHLQNIFRF